MKHYNPVQMNLEGGAGSTVDDVQLITILQQLVDTQIGGEIQRPDEELTNFFKSIIDDSRVGPYGYDHWR